MGLCAWLQWWYVAFAPRVGRQGGTLLIPSLDACRKDMKMRILIGVGIAVLVIIIVGSSRSYLATSPRGPTNAQPAVPIVVNK